MRQVVGRRRVQGLDRVDSDNLLLHREAELGPVLRGRGLAGQRQLDAVFGQHLVGDVQESKTLARPTYGTAW